MSSWGVSASGTGASPKMRGLPSPPLLRIHLLIFIFSTSRPFRSLPDSSRSLTLVSCPFFETPSIVICQCHYSPLIESLSSLCPTAGIGSQNSHESIPECRFQFKLSSILFSSFWSDPCYQYRYRHPLAGGDSLPVPAAATRISQQPFGPHRQKSCCKSEARVFI